MAKIALNSKHSKPARRALRALEGPDPEKRREAVRWLAENGTEGQLLDALATLEHRLEETEDQLDEALADPADEAPDNDDAPFMNTIVALLDNEDDLSEAELALALRAIQGEELSAREVDRLSMCAHFILG